MKMETLKRANEITDRIERLERAIKWIDAGGTITLMGNKQISNSIELSDIQKDIMSAEFRKEADSLRKELDEL